MTESMPATGAGGPTGRSLALRAAIVSGGAVAALGLLYGVSLALIGSDIPRGTQVLGVPVGGRSLDAGAARLATDLPAVLPRQMSVVAGDRTLSRSAADLGLGVDHAATARNARAGWASPLRSIPALFGAGRDVEPVAGVNADLLTAGVEGMSSEITTNFVEGALTFDTGVPVAVNPSKGRGLDTAGAAAELERAFLAGRSEAQGKIIELFPAVDAAAVQRALAGIGARAVSGPVTIKVAKSLVELQPAEFGRFLSTAPENGELRLVVDAEGLVSNLQVEVKELGRKPRDARFEITGGKVTIVPSKPGVTLDVAILTDSLADTLTGVGPRTVDAGAKTEEPDLTTEEAEALNITEKMGSFKTFYPIAPYRITNIGRAAKLINGSIVKPGEIWSLNKTVGERTTKNGFVRGFIIKQGQFVEDLGGGVSQSATTTFNAVFFAGLKDIEHHPHSLYIGRYPAGREATVAFGSKDLRFENDSGNGVYIQAKGVPGSIEVTMWGTKVYDKITSVSSPKRNFVNPRTVESDAPDCEPQQPVDGFDITVTRIFRNDGEEVKRESFNTHYDPTDKIVCVEKGKSTASPSPSSSRSPSAGPKPTKTKTPAPSSTPAPSPTPTAAEDPALPVNPAGKPGTDQD